MILILITWLICDTISSGYEVIFSKKNPPCFLTFARHALQTYPCSFFYWSFAPNWMEKNKQKVNLCYIVKQEFEFEHNWWRHFWSRHFALQSQRLKATGFPYFSFENLENMLTYINLIKLTFDEKQKLQISADLEVIKRFSHLLHSITHLIQFFIWWTVNWITQADA